MAAVLEGEELEAALLAYCKNASAAADTAAVAADASFEKGIGGTKADHIAEKVLTPAPSPLAPPHLTPLTALPSPPSPLSHPLAPHASLHPLVRLFLILSGDPLLVLVSLYPLL